MSKPVAPPRGKATAPTHPIPTPPPPPTVGYRDIAWWAETADGFRGENLVLARVEENGQVKYAVKKAKDVNRRDVALNIRTEKLCPKRPEVTNITIEVEGQTRKIDCRMKDGSLCDAVFCTESAMEKFLFPYYRSQRLLTDEDWAELQKAFLDPNVIIIAHVAPSHPVAASQGTDGMFYVLKRRLGLVEGLAWMSLGQYLSQQS